MSDHRTISLPDAVAQVDRVIICPNKHRTPFAQLIQRTCYTGLSEVSRVDSGRTDLCCPSCPLGTPPIAQLTIYTRPHSITLKRGTLWLTVIDSDGESSSP